ncbi:MAG: cellulase family glycosylhydrolase [Chloroflexota bacterium]
MSHCAEPETIWGVGPWTGNNDWRTYADQFATTAGEIAAHYRRYGDRVAYQIWNEGDKQNNPASVYVAPEDYAEVLARGAAAIRNAAPQSPIIFNGMATGPQETVVYVKRCREALGGNLPVDAIGVHPYTRWARRAPFDWGQRYGTLGDAIATYERELPEMKLWITEIGVADDNEIGPEHYPAISDYFVDVMTYMEERHTARVPVVFWFAWSDWMRNAGIVRRDGAHKEHLYSAFRNIRNRELS